VEEAALVQGAAVETAGLAGEITVRSGVLEIRAETGGPADGPPVLLVHGWPDAPRGWRPVARRLESAGWRTITPYLRGSGPTRFLDAQTPRSAQATALAQDLIDLADGLGLERFAVIGHDWGARTAYTAAALFPGRVAAIAALALAYQPGGEYTVPGFSQARAFWYQWFLCLEQGAEAVRRDPAGFARIQWDTWSPPGWFDDAEFARTAESFTNPDWVPLTLNAYRSRYLAGEARDLRYAGLDQRLGATGQVARPALMIQGGADRCDEPGSSAGQNRFFTGGYRRVVLEGAGHFPHREAPAETGELLISHLRAHWPA
jgi:pimeloyl-ACP methyl ester carboxylesterase